MDIGFSVRVVFVDELYLWTTKGRPLTGRQFLNLQVGFVRAFLIGQDTKPSGQTVDRCVFCLVGHEQGTFDLKIRIGLLENQILVGHIVDVLLSIFVRFLYIIGIVTFGLDFDEVKAIPSFLQNINPYQFLIGENGRFEQSTLCSMVEPIPGLIHTILRRFRGNFPPILIEKGGHFANHIATFRQHLHVSVRVSGGRVATFFVDQLLLACGGQLKIAFRKGFWGHWRWN